MEIKVIENLKRKRMLLVLGAIFGVTLSIIGLVISSLHTSIVGFMLLIVSMFDKTQRITEEGFESRYTFAGFQLKKEIWRFKDIQEIHMERIPNKKYCVVFFIKGDMAKKAAFQKEMIESIKEISKSANENIILS